MRPAGYFNPPPDLRRAPHQFLPSMLPFYVLSVLLAFAPAASCYDIVKDYSGDAFFEAWDFYGSWDNLTLGKQIGSNNIEGELDGRCVHLQATCGG